MVHKASRDLTPKLFPSFIAYHFFSFLTLLQPLDLPVVLWTPKVFKFYSLSSIVCQRIRQRPPKTKHSYIHAQTLHKQKHKAGSVVLLVRENMPKKKVSLRVKQKLFGSVAVCLSY